MTIPRGYLACGILTVTEFETATLALREAALFTAIAHVVVALLIGFGQIGIVYYGIREMGKMSDERAKEAKKRAKEAKKRDKADARRHTEAMTALEALIRRTSGPQTA